MNYILTKDNARGNRQFWKIGVNNIDISIEWGVENGKTQQNIYSITDGKQNRTANEQALFVATSLMGKKLRTGYTIDGEIGPEKSPLPMLAKEYKYTQSMENMKVAIQPKLDGIRCIANVKTGQLWSRKQTSIKGLEHISKTLLESTFPDDITWIDGELYMHESSFNEISSNVRRTTNFTDKSINIRYWVYDCISKHPFKDRIKIIEKSLVQTKELILTETKFVRLSQDVMKALHKDAIDNNYEGIMVRKEDSLYEDGKRSSNLLKYKDCMQEEFKVIGFKQKKVVNGTITLGSVILQSFTNKDVQFNATPTMTNAEKIEIWENQLNYLGQTATVKFFEKTPNNIPRFPRLIGFRHPDDC